MDFSKETEFEKCFHQREGESPADVEQELTPASCTPIPIYHSCGQHDYRCCVTSQARTGAKVTNVLGKVETAQISGKSFILVMVSLAIHCGK